MLSGWGSRSASCSNHHGDMQMGVLRHLPGVDGMGNNIPLGDDGARGC